jgi:cytochrome P450
MGMSFGYGTVDVTTQLALEHDLNTLEQEGDVLQRRLEHVLPGLTRRLFATVPLWRFVKLGPERRLEAALGEVFVLLREVLEAGRTRVAALPGRAPATFLEAMILARDEEGRPFSDSQILGNAIEILLAGEDTTALTLSWAVHELCDAPAALAALQAEADAVPGGDVAPADFEVAGRLDVAGSIAQETMRLRPVAPLVILETNVATVLGDVALSVGQRVALLMRTPAVSAQRFADPAAFRPERWLEPTTDGAHDTGALMPFGSGPRLCPGRALALLEMRVALATLGASFDLERLGERRGVSERFAFTMGPRGLRIRLRPRASRVRSERPPPREATPTGWRPSTEAQNRERHGQFNCGDQAVARGDGSTARACRPGARAGLRALPFVADRAAVWRERVRCQHWS